MERPAGVEPQQPVDGDLDHGKRRAKFMAGVTGKAALTFGEVRDASHQVLQGLGQQPLFSVCFLNRFPAGNVLFYSNKAADVAIFI